MKIKEKSTFPYKNKSEKERKIVSAANYIEKPYRTRDSDDRVKKRKPRKGTETN